MAESVFQAPIPDSPAGLRGGFSVATAAHLRELAIGISAALAVTAFVCFHWSFALVGGLAVFALALAGNELFILTLIFLVPVGWIVSADIPIKNVTVAIRILAVAGFFLGRLLRGQFNGRLPGASSITRASVVFLFIAAASNFLGGVGWSHESLRSIYDLAAFIGFYLMILVWVDSRQRLKKALAALLYSTVATAAFAMVQEMAGGFTFLWLRLSPSGQDFDPWNGRAPSFLNYSNSLAGYLNLILPFACACCLIGQGRWKRLGWLAAALGFLALLSTQSLGGLVAFLATLILVIFCFIANRKRRTLLLAGVCVAVILLYVLRNVVSPAHAEDALGPDAVMRVLLWSTAWELFVHSPVFGVGWGNFINLYGAYVSPYADWIKPGVFGIHNIYLELLAETGVVGFGAFSYLFVQTGRRAWEQFRSSSDFLHRALAFGVMGALLSVLVHGCVDFLFQVSPQFGTLFWVLLALLVAIGRLDRSNGQAYPALARPASAGRK